MTDPTPAPSMSVNRKLKTHYSLLVVALLGGAFLYGPHQSAMPLGQWVLSCLVVGTFTALPLLGFVAAAFRPNPGRVSWLSFILLGYLIFGIVLAFSPRGLVPGVAISAATLSTFGYAVIWLRPFKKAAKARQKAEASQQR
ncbi:MAG: DUF2069 domain-containing protein [Saccharospirillum sp.]|nr:DUF2069 domain-containing protein [Saccharospirillum sp.]